jgi:hypothetical protein
MFDPRESFQRRVHIKKGARQSVHIDRQNLRGKYFWFICLDTVVFGAFNKMLWHAWKLNQNDMLYFTLPVFVFGFVAYMVVLAIGLWGAFGIEEVSIHEDNLRCTRTVLRWSRTRDIPFANIKEIRAITPRFARLGLESTVEIRTGWTARKIGANLLRDEAVELAKHLRHAVGLNR